MTFLLPLRHLTQVTKRSGAGNQKPCPQKRQKFFLMQIYWNTALDKQGCLFVGLLWSRLTSAEHQIFQVQSGLSNKTNLITGKCQSITWPLGLAPLSWSRTNFSYLTCHHNTIQGSWKCVHFIRRKYLETNNNISPICILSFQC